MYTNDIIHVDYFYRASKQDKNFLFPFILNRNNYEYNEIKHQFEYSFDEVKSIYNSEDLVYRPQYEIPYDNTDKLLMDLC